MKKVLIVLVGVFLCIFLVTPVQASLIGPEELTKDDLKNFGPNYLDGFYSFDNYFYFKYEPVVDGTMNGITFDVRETADGPVFDFTCAEGILVYAMLVKGGTVANLYNYWDELGYAVAADTGLHAPVNPNTGKFYGLSHVEVGAAVPEPATMMLLGSGLIGLAAFGRKRLFKKV